MTGLAPNIAQSLAFVLASHASYPLVSTWTFYKANFSLLKLSLLIPAETSISFSQVLTSKTSSTKMIQISSDIVIKLGPTLLELLKAVMQASQTKRRGNKDQNSKEGSESKWHDMLLEFPVLIDSFKSLLHIFSVSEKSRYL